MLQGTDDQTAVVALLSRAGTYGERGTVRRIDSHISHLFLIGEHAFKLKRAVRLPYLDFTGVDNRRRYCEVEVTVNRRTAPEIYLGLAPLLQGADGASVLGAVVEPGDAGAVEGACDWVVVMRRFDQDCLFDAMARTGTLTPPLVARLATVIARFHDGAAVAGGFGGGGAMARVIADGTELIRCFVPQVFDAEHVEDFTARIADALDGAGPLLDARRGAGMVRHCHGDLHLRNICLIDGQPTPFDAIEFSDEIAHIDVLYDLAFLLMDLQHRGHRGLANIALNKYLDMWGDYGGLGAMGLFLSCRAAVRAHVEALQTVPGAGDNTFAVGEARAYLELAISYLDPPAPRLVALGGLSGTGKSVLAEALAPDFGPHSGAVVIRSDVIRKQLAGVAPDSRLGPETYDDEMNRKVYERMCRVAGDVLGAGFSVIVDAVHARATERDAIARAAGLSGATFDGLWLAAPDAVRIVRVRDRRGDASDATAGIATSQAEYDVGDVFWHRIDAAGAVTSVSAMGRKVLNLGKKSLIL